MDDPRSGASGKRRPRVGVRGLLAVVACSGVVAWSLRTVLDTTPARDRVRALRSGDPADRRRAARDLGYLDLGEPELVIRSLTDALRDEDAEVRADAARSLGAVGGKAAEAGQARAGPLMARLIVLLKDRDRDARVAAAFALGSVGGAAGLPPPTELVAALEHDPDLDIRVAAAIALGLFVAESDPAVAPLVRAADDPEPLLRESAHRSMVQLRPTPAAVPALVAGLGLRSREARAGSAVLLGLIGPKAVAAVPGLAVLALEPVDPEVLARPYLVNPDRPDPARQAVAALGRVAPFSPSAGRAVAALTEALRAGDHVRRDVAARALAKFGGDALPALPALIGALKSRGASRPYGSGEALAFAIGRLAPGTPMAAEAVEALGACLDHGRDPILRQAAVEALAGFGPAARPAIPALRALGRRSEAGSRGLDASVSAALEAIEGKPGAAVP